MTTAREPAPAARVFRLPPMTYVVVVFLVFGAIPLAVAGDGSYASRGEVTARLLFLLVPVVAAVFIWRTATVVDGAGVTVRAAFGSRRIAWDEIEGLSLTGRAVYLVLAAGGSIRMPCVTVADLAAVARASAGRLPEIAEPVRRSAPRRGSPRRR